MTRRPHVSCTVFATNMRIVGMPAMFLFASHALAAPGPDELNTMAVFRDASRGVVHVTTTEKPSQGTEAGRTGVGTGFVLDSFGHVVTAHHVIQGRDQIRATLANGEHYAARVVGTSAE